MNKSVEKEELSRREIWWIGFFLSLTSLTITFLVFLLRRFGRFIERELEPFPKSPSKLVISMNHPDGGNEWLFIYPHFFRWSHFIKPRVAIQEYPCVLADLINFYRNPDLNLPLLKKLVEQKIIPVDRKRDQGYAQGSALRRSISALSEGKNIIGFFEGGRTKTRDTHKCGRTGKKIGILKESLGVLALQEEVKVKSGWIEFPYPNYFPCLQRNGRFSGTRFLRWYWKTLIGRNGKIVLLWGSLKQQFGEEDSEQVTRELENYLLELGDKLE